MWPFFFIFIILYLPNFAIPTGNDPQKHEGTARSEDEPSPERLTDQNVERNNQNDQAGPSNLFESLQRHGRRVAVVVVQQTEHDAESERQRQVQPVHGIHIREPSGLQTRLAALAHPIRAVPNLLLRPVASRSIANLGQAGIQQQQHIWPQRAQGVQQDVLLPRLQGVQQQHQQDMHLQRLQRKLQQIQGYQADGQQHLDSLIQQLKHEIEIILQFRQGGTIAGATPSAGSSNVPAVDPLRAREAIEPERRVEQQHERGEQRGRLEDDGHEVGDDLKQKRQRKD